MDKLKRALRGNDESAGGSAAEEERGIIGEALDASTLSWSTRVKGFIACFVLGCVISILSTILFALTYNLVIRTWCCSLSCLICEMTHAHCLQIKISWQQLEFQLLFLKPRIDNSLSHSQKSINESISVTSISILNSVSWHPCKTPASLVFKSDERTIMKSNIARIWIYFLDIPGYIFGPLQSGKRRCAV